MKIITRETAKSLGLSRYFTGQPCKRGHIAERQTSNTACIECHRAGARESYHTNRDSILAKKVEYQKRADVKARMKRYMTAYYAENSAKFSDANRRYYDENKAAIADTAREDRIRNPAKFAARDARKRAEKLQATPCWLTQEQHMQIEAIYETAQRLTRETGVLHHVDHVVPLRGKRVCGLHVPWNLKAVPAKANMHKSNKFEE